MGAVFGAFKGDKFAFFGELNGAEPQGAVKAYSEVAALVLPVEVTAFFIVFYRQSDFALGLPVAFLR